MATDLPDLAVPPAVPRVAYYGFTGPIESGSATRIATALNRAVNGGYDQVYLCLSSVGGHVADGIYLYNHIRGLPIRVDIHNIGTVASIATAVFVAGERRLTSPHGMFLIHPTEMSSHARMRAEQLNADLSAVLADDQRTEGILRERARIPDTVLTARRLHDVYITPESALEYGLVHEVCDFRLPRETEILQI